MILLLPPALNAFEQLRIVMSRNGYTTFQEIEPKAGCRRFRLS